MPYSEYVNWLKFFQRRPEGWREDQRAAMIMKSFGVKQQPQDLFPSLKAIHKSNEPKPDQAKPAGKFFQKMLSAEGGDAAQLSWLTGE